MKYEPPDGDEPMPMKAGTKLADSPAMPDVARAREGRARRRRLAVDGAITGFSRARMARTFS